MCSTIDISSLRPLDSSCGGDEGNGEGGVGGEGGEGGGWCGR